MKTKLKFLIYDLALSYLIIDNIFVPSPYKPTLIKIRESYIFSWILMYVLSDHVYDSTYDFPHSKSF